MLLSSMSDPSNSHFFMTHFLADTYFLLYGIKNGYDISKMVLLGLKENTQCNKTICLSFMTYLTLFDSILL